MANGNDASGRYPTRAVIDTNVIINLALGDHDRGLPQDASRRSKRLVDDGLGGKYELLVPSMVLVELFSNHELRSNRDGVSSEYIQNCHRRICEWCIDADFLTIDLNEDAADWIHDHPHLQDIRPGDAAILASAWFAGAPSYIHGMQNLRDVCKGQMNWNHWELSFGNHRSYLPQTCWT